MKDFVPKSICFAEAFLLLVASASAQDYAIDSFTIDSGGGTSSGSGYAVSGVITQPGADLMNGGDFSLAGEFRSLIAPVPPAVVVPSATLFDNTSGGANGLEDAIPGKWLANRFCLGARAYQLDSVALNLVSGDNNGEPRLRTVRLEIFASDPVTGKPSIPTGPVMNLSGATNPISLPPGFAETPIKWVPATPFKLSANTCYWAVLIVDSGIVSETASVSLPTGDAAALGRASSTDGGAAWALDPNSNRKMLIQGTPVTGSSIGPQLAADLSIAIPGGVGNFTSLPGGPSLSGDDLVFFGAGLDGQQGVYLQNRPLPQELARIADLDTLIPKGTGKFQSFGSEAGIIIVGGKVVFTGHGSGGQQGIYSADRAQASALVRIADTATPIPGGAGNFLSFGSEAGIIIVGGHIVYSGSGSGGQQGIYLTDPAQPNTPFRIADTETAIPGGTGTFVAFPGAPAAGDSQVVFIGHGSNAQLGLYTVAVLAPLQIGSPFPIADTATPIPGGNGNFTAFGGDLAQPVDPAMSGGRLAFVGSGSGGQQGVYTIASIAPPQIASPLRVADTSTAIPGGTGKFIGFGAVSVSQTDVAFLGRGSGGQTGVYDMTAGQLLKVVAVGDSIAGKVIAGLNFSRHGLSGDPLAFQATFRDGSQGVYTVDVMAPAAGPRITAVERAGNELRLGFTSAAGRIYGVESSADLILGTWQKVTNTEVSATSGTTEITLSIPSADSARFYRVLESGSFRDLQN